MGPTSREVLPQNEHVFTRRPRNPPPPLPPDPEPPPPPPPTRWLSPKGSPRPLRREPPLPPEASRGREVAAGVARGRGESAIVKSAQGSGNSRDGRSPRWGRRQCTARHPVGRAGVD